MFLIKILLLAIKIARSECVVESYKDIPDEHATLGLAQPVLTVYLLMFTNMLGPSRTVTFAQMSF